MACVRCEEATEPPALERPAFALGHGRTRTDIVADMPQGMLDHLASALGERYAIERELGAGGMATVYLAEDRKHRRKVAIKVLRPELTAALGSERFVREIAVSAQLTHPHILPLFDSGDADGVLYFVMPYIEGETLRQRIVQEGRLGVQEVARLTEQVASALSYAHARGIVHRDVKPENILLVGDQAIVADFGIAHALEAAGAERLTGTGLFVGTPAYMSPEQALGAKVDGRADVYALGCVVYEMLVGHPPFEGHARALLVRRAAEDAPALRTLDSAIPQYVDRAVGRALAREVSERFPTPVEFASALTLGGSLQNQDLPAGTSGLQDMEQSRHGASLAAATHAPRRWRRMVPAAVLALGAAAILLGVRYRDFLGLRPSPVTPAVVVRPFANLSPEEGQEDFVAEMTEGVARELGAMGNVKVLAVPWSDDTLDARVLAQRLAADAVVTGEVLRVGQDLQLTVRLADGNTDTLLWTNSYEREYRDVFALQREVAFDLARHAGRGNSTAEWRRLEARRARPVHTPDPQALGAYHAARVLKRRWEHMAEALDSARLAVRRDPNFALAHATLAEVCFMKASNQPESLGECREAASRAIALEPALADAHTMIGVSRYYQREWEGAEAAFRTAIELNPSSVEAYRWYESLLRTTMRLEEASQVIEKALQLDPTNVLLQAMVGWPMINALRYEEALAVWDRVIERDSNAATAIYNKGLVYVLQGEGEKALVAARRSFDLDDDPAARWLIAVAHAALGDREQALGISSALEDSLPGMLSNIAVVHLLLGDREAALERLEIACERRDPALLSLISEPWFQSLRDEPRYRTVRRRMGLEPTQQGPRTSP